MTVKLSIPASLLIGGSVGRQTIGSLGSSEDSTTGSLKKPSFSERHPKAIRSVTVIGYLFCVSLAAILLSAYYVVFWKPATKDALKNPINVNTTSLPCRTIYPTENGGTQFIQQQSYRPYSSRYKHSRFLILVSPPKPGRLESVPNNESPQNELSSNSSLYRTISTQNLEPEHYESDENPSTSRTTSASTFIDEHEEQGESGQEVDVADSTYVPNSSTPTLKSIILQKLIRERSNKNVIYK